MKSKRTLPNISVTSDDINYESSIKIQLLIAKFPLTSISKTDAVWIIYRIKFCVKFIYYKA